MYIKREGMPAKIVMHVNGSNSTTNDFNVYFLETRRNVACNVASVSLSSEIMPRIFHLVSVPRSVSISFLKSVDVGHGLTFFPLPSKKGF